MGIGTKIMTYAITLAVISCGVLGAARWWEKGLAKVSEAPIISPNGCYRVEILKPFWILPAMFHPKAHPDELDTPKWFPWWSYPGFYRLYDNRNGLLIGESHIHDLTSAGGPLFWGDSWFPEISAGLITIGPNLADCIGDRPGIPQVQQ